MSMHPGIMRRRRKVRSTTSSPIPSAEAIACALWDIEPTDDSLFAIAGERAGATGASDTRARHTSRRHSSTRATEFRSNRTGDAQRNRVSLAFSVSMNGGRQRNWNLSFPVATGNLKNHLCDRQRNLENHITGHVGVLLNNLRH